MVWSVSAPPFARWISIMATPYLIARPARLSSEDTLCIRNAGSEGDSTPSSRSSSISPMDDDESASSSSPASRAVLPAMRERDGADAKDASDVRERATKCASRRRPGRTYR